MSLPLTTHHSGHFILPNDSKKNSPYLITVWRALIKEKNSPKDIKWHLFKSDTPQNTEPSEKFPPIAVELSLNTSSVFFKETSPLSHLGRTCWALTHPCCSSKWFPLGESWHPQPPATQGLPGHVRQASQQPGSVLTLLPPFSPFALISSVSLSRGFSGKEHHIEKWIGKVESWTWPSP